MKNTVKTKVVTEITVPKVPNYIMVGNAVKPVSSLTIKELKLIGKQWTKDLIQRASEQSQNPKKW